MSLKSSALTLGLLLSWSALVAPGMAQDVRWLDLPQLRFVTPEVSESVAEKAPLPPPPPLFTPETMARDASPDMVQLANNPTLENARLVYDLQERKVRAIRILTSLLQQVATERKR